MSSRERPRSPPGPQGKPPRGGRPGILLGGREPGVVSRSVLVPLVDSREYLRFLVQGPAGALAFSRGVPILPRVVSARTTDTWARGVRSRFGARPSAPTRCQAAGHALASARDPDLAPPATSISSTTSLAPSTRPRSGGSDRCALEAGSVLRLCGLRLPGSAGPKIVLEHKLQAVTEACDSGPRLRPGSLVFGGDSA